MSLNQARPSASAIAAACLSALLILPEPAAAQPGSLEQQRQAVFNVF